ncbi:MAG: cbb3-type cytochrome c oxidase subunit I [Planctomycetes bacterium]|nr:cbb3-type cytochrome c oxidase subunit I [Planctomycetota bacterium]
MTQAASGTSSVSNVVHSTMPKESVDGTIVMAYLVASLAYLFMAIVAGMLFSLQLLQAYPFPGIELFSPGRWRMVHTDTVVYGFIANAFLAVLHWSIPRLTTSSVLSVKLSWFVFVAWQVVVVAGVVGIVMGFAQAVPWGESPTFVDPIAQLGLILVAINLLPPILKVAGPLDIPLWYFLAAIVWAVLVFGMGNFVPEYLLGGTASGAIIALFHHDVVGLIVTPLGWGLMYYFVPVILERPIYSRKLALIGFWGLAVFSPFAGVRHLLYSPIPMVLQYTAMVATMALELTAITVIINFFLTIRGQGEKLRTCMAIRWFYLGLMFYFAASVQSVVQVTLPLRNITHFSDWVVGHSHLVMFGVFGFWILGTMVHLIPRLLGANGWYDPNWNAWHFRLTGIGMLIMFLALLIAGWIQGYHWRNLAPWDVSIAASKPFWLVRTMSGVVIFAGQALFLFNILMTWVHRGAIPNGCRHGKR